MFDCLPRLPVARGGMSALPPKAESAHRTESVKGPTRIHRSAVIKRDLVSYLAPCRNFQCLAGKPVTEILNLGLVDCTVFSMGPLWPSHFPEESSPLCELFHIGTQRGHPIICIRIVHEYRELQMSYEFDRTYLEEAVMLSALALFLVLAFVMPA